MRCIELALENPPERGERTKIFNQMTEVHRIRDLANLVHEMSGTPIAFVPNPRQEASENELEVDNKQFMDLGLKPVTLKVGMLSELVEVAKKYKHRIDMKRIPAQSAWTKEIGRNITSIIDIDNRRRTA